MYCRKCGKKIFNDSVYCSFCGHKVKPIEEKELSINALEEDANRETDIKSIDKDKNAFLPEIVGLNSNLSNAIVIFSFLTPIITTVIILTNFGSLELSYLIAFLCFQVPYFVVLVSCSVKIPDGKMWLWLHFGLSIFTAIPILMVMDICYSNVYYRKKIIDFEVSSSDLEQAKETVAFYDPNTKAIISYLDLPTDSKICGDIWIKVKNTVYRRITFITAEGFKKNSFFIPSKNAGLPK